MSSLQNPESDRQRAVDELIALLESWTDVTEDEARRPYRTLRVRSA
jgi:hypothetical protein